MFRLPLKSIHYLSRRLIPEPSLTGLHARVAEIGFPQEGSVDERRRIRMAVQRPDPWKTEEDLRLLELVEAGKFWVLIAAKLKRSIKRLQATAF
jgi:hypothetical protein